MKLLLSIFFIIAITSNAAHAASINWWFTNSGETWTSTESIEMQASLTNTGATAIELGNIDTGIGGAVLSWGTFPASPSNRDYRHYFRYSNTLAPDESLYLEPGETIDFIFGEFIPQVVIESGFYEINSAGLTINSMAYTYSSNLFNATVVPLPASIWLFITGLIGLLSASLNKLKISNN